MARQKTIGRPTGRPIVPDYTDTDVGSFQVMPDGRRMERTLFGLTEEQVGRIRAGYVCLQCLEDHDVAFPDACVVCRYPMRERQTADFQQDYRGEIKFGPSTTIDDEYGIAEEMIQRDAYDKARKLGLILPKYL